MQNKERVIARTIVHYWRIINLVYEMNESLQRAKGIDEVLAVGAEFSASVTDADGSFVYIPEGRIKETSCVFTFPQDIALAQDQLLSPGHPLSQLVLLKGERWQEQNLMPEDQNRLGLLGISASAVLAVPLKRHSRETIGSILVWKKQNGTRFIGEEADRLHLCANQTTLIVENLRVQAEKMAAWETLSKAIAYQILNPVTLMEMWLEELGRDASIHCADIGYTHHILKDFVPKMKEVLKETEVATHEFLFDFDPGTAHNRIIVDVYVMVQESLGDIPKKQYQVIVEDQGIQIFVNRRRLKTALRDISQTAMARLPAEEKLQVKVRKSSYEGMAAQIDFFFPKSFAGQPGESGSIFLFGQDDLIKRLIGLDNGLFREYSDDNNHVITVTFPSP